MEACCNPSYDNEFDLKLAQRELKQYLKSGLKKSSKPMVDGLRSLNINNKTLLDIGSGVGSVIFELSKEGLEKSTYVDISSGYSDTFRQEVHRKDLMDKVEIYREDFLQIHSNILPVDLVTLDKSICCYENYRELVQVSLEKSKRWYAFIIPRDTWWVRAFHGLALIWRKIARSSSFRSWVHPVDEIREVIQARGFQEILMVNRREWLTMIYEKSD